MREDERGRMMGEGMRGRGRWTDRVAEGGGL